MDWQREKIKPKRSLGQNFLTDDNIARNIVQSLQAQSCDLVVEIGPGRGALTRHLSAGSARVIAIEIDKRIVRQLRSSLKTENVEIINEDFLNIDLRSLSDKHRTKLRVIGNIPYNLTSPILFKVFEERQAVLDLTIMMQKEVARRIIAKPFTKDYGILSVISQYYGSTEILFNVPPSCFFPRPNVNSSVVRICISGNPTSGIDDELFRTIVKTTFGKRRKMLRNSLLYLPFDISVIERIVAHPGVPREKRPEELTVGDFIDLTKTVAEITLRERTDNRKDNP